MAKSSGGGRLRVFLAEFEGDNASIQEGLRAISAAINKTFQAPQVLRYMPPPTVGVVQNPPDVEDLSSAEEEGDLAGSQPRPQPRGKRKLPALSVVKDLDLHPDGQQSFRDLYAEKEPKTQFDQIVVAVYYLHRILERNGITPNHVYTCFKDVNAKVPNDLPQIIRNCAAKNGWLDITDSNNIKITQPGENAVDHDLPRKKV
jgi:hypothetical protein